MNGAHLLAAMVLWGLYELWRHRCEWLGLHSKGKVYSYTLGDGSRFRAERCPHCGHMERLP